MDYLIIGFLLGILFGGWLVSFFIKVMKKSGYITFDVTDKFKKEFFT